MPANLLATIRPAEVRLRLGRHLMTVALWLITHKDDNCTINYWCNCTILIPENRIIVSIPNTYVCQNHFRSNYPTN